MAYEGFYAVKEAVCKFDKLFYHELCDIAFMRMEQVVEKTLKMFFDIK